MGEFEKCSKCHIGPIVNRKYKLCEGCNCIRLHGVTLFERQLAREQDKVLKPRKKRKRNKGNAQRIEKIQIVRDKDKETYRKVFELKENKCEECGIELPCYFEDENGRVIMISQYSHCLSRGAYCEYRRESWNIQRLCLQHHSQWEFGDRKSMKIYPIYKKIILENTGKDILK